MDTENNILTEKFFRLQVLMHRFHHQMHKEHGPFGNPHRGQGRILSLLKMQPEISQKELSYLLDMRAQSLGELLMKLERSGFIARTPSEDDRRVVNIKLTDEGLKAANKPDEGAGQEDLFSSLTEEEQQNLGVLLDKLIAGFEARFPAEEGRERHKFAGFHGRGMHGEGFGPMGCHSHKGGLHGHHQRRGCHGHDTHKHHGHYEQHEKHEQHGRHEERSHGRHERRENASENGQR